MARFNLPWMTVVALVFTTCSMAAPTPSANHSAIDAKIDIAFLLPHYSNQQKLDKVKWAWGVYLREYAEDGVEIRSAAVVLDQESDAKVMVQLTKDEAALERAIRSMNISAHPSQPHAAAFQKMREEVFDFSKSDRAKVVAAYISNFSANPETAKSEAKRLRQKGAFIYVIYDQSMNGLKEEAEAYAGSPTRIFGVPASDLVRHEGLERFSEILLDVLPRDLCSFCHYHDESRSCKSVLRPLGMKTDYFGDNNAKCQRMQVSDARCSDEDCADECNRQWPLKGGDCDASNYGDVKGRSSNKPPVKMEYCPTSVTCTTTTPSTTSTTTTSTTTTSTATTDSPAELRGVSDSDLDFKKLVIPISVGAVLAFAVIIAIVVAVVITVKRRKSSKKEIESKTMPGKKSKLSPSSSSKPTVPGKEKSIHIGEKSEMTNKSKGSAVKGIKDSSTSTIARSELKKGVAPTPSPSSMKTGKEKSDSAKPDGGKTTKSTSTTKDALSKPEGGKTSKAKSTTKDAPAKKPVKESKAAFYEQKKGDVAARSSPKIAKKQ